MKYAKWIGGGLGWAFGGPIGALIGFALGSLFDTDDKTEGQSRRRHTAAGDFKMSLLVLIACIIKADGTVKASELATVRRILNANFGRQETDDAMNILDRLLSQNIDETEVGRIHEGMPVKLTLGALQDLSFDAVLEYISPKGVEENGANQFEIKAAIQVPDSVFIRSGYSANAEIVLQRARQVLTVPESVLEFSGDSAFVWLMTDSVPPQYRRQQVTVGLSDGLRIQIKEGLRPTDRLRGAEKTTKNV